MPQQDLSALDPELKSVFVISPIGKLDDSGFDFTTLFLEEIVKPAAMEAGGFKVPIRADEVRTPGSITAKVVRDIVSAHVCVADLTGRNPNVMYEVAIAHAADKPVILLQQESGGPPFDFTDERVIRYSTRADEANRAREQLVEHLQNAHHEEEDERLKQTMHPVRVVFRELQTRATATDAQQVILDRLDRMNEGMQSLASLVQVRTPDVGNHIDHSLRKNSSPPKPHTLAEYKLLAAKANALTEKFLDVESQKLMATIIASDSPDWDGMASLYAALRRVDRTIRMDKDPSVAIREAQRHIRLLLPF